MRDRLAEKYRAELLAADPIRREVARRLLARLGSADLRPRALSGTAAVRWSQVPIGDLFAEQENRVRPRSGGLLEAGHEPIHASKGGRCVLIDKAGRWWCRSCRRSGDAATYLADVLGCSYVEAAARLAERYGPPTGRRVWRRRALEA